MKRTAFLAFAAVALSACTSLAPTQAPLLSPFGDGTQWIVWQDIEFLAELNDKTTVSIVVPRGFVTDLASTPREVWSIYPPFGKYLSASILHDYLYWRQVCDPVEADQLIYQAMRDAGADQATQSRFYAVLRKVGATAWSENRAAKEQGYVRVIPEPYLSAPPVGALKPTTIWLDLREDLKRREAREVVHSDGAQIANACKSLGKEIKVKSSISAILFGR